MTHATLPRTGILRYEPVHALATLLFWIVGGSVQFMGFLMGAILIVAAITFPLLLLGALISNGRWP